MWKQKLLICLTSFLRSSNLYSTQLIQRNYCYILNMLIVCCRSICKGCCLHCFWMHLFLLKSGALILVNNPYTKKSDNHWGLFNNYVTLKLPFFDRNLPSRFIANDLKTPLYLTSRLYHFFLFWSWKKTPKIRTHDTSNDVFKPLNQFIRFK